MLGSGWKPGMTGFWKRGMRKGGHDTLRAVRRFCLTLTALLCAARPAAATYSIVATDQATEQVGGAGTSCIGGADVYIIYGTAPGFGVVHAQASANEDG